MKPASTPSPPSHSAQDSYEQFRKTKVFGSLDGLRAISILAVIWHHAGVPWSLTGRASANGTLGVEFFFLISGFLITTLLLREKEKFGTINLKFFYARRSLRIFPIYYSVIFIYAVLVFLTDRHSEAGRGFFQNLPYFLTYTSNWFVELGPRVIFYFAWSLAVEEQFYVFWPSVEKWTRSRVATFTAFSLCLISMWLSFNPFFEFDHKTGFETIVGKISTNICMGVLLAHLLHSKSGFKIAWKFFGCKFSSAVAFILFSVAFGLWHHFQIRPPNILFLLMFMMLATSVIREDHAMATFLKWPPLVYIGKISYGMYLLHMLAYNGAKVLLNHLPHDFKNPLTSFIATTMIAIIIAGLSYRFFELPILRLKERFTRIPNVPLVRSSS